MKRLLTAGLVAAVVISAVPSARAAVNVERRGDENAVVEIFRSTLYGAGAGLIVGGAIALAIKDDSGEPWRWGFVAGTFAGLGYGIYQVSKRPPPTALLELHEGGLRAHALPTIEAGAGGARVHLVSMRF
jgi:MFS family permease